MTEPTEEKNYIGVRKCGCATSALLDDGLWEPGKIESWIAEVESRGMVVEVWDRARIKAKFGYCSEHKPVEQKELF